MYPEHHEIFVGGRFTTPHSDARLTLVNPATEEQIATAPDGDEADIDHAVQAARGALTDWRRTTYQERAAHLRALADAFEARQDEMSHLITWQNGSPGWFSDRVNGTGPVGRYRAAAAGADRADPPAWVEANGVRSLLHREPVGVVGIIVPWNAPQTLLAVRLGPALAAGCTVVVKPSPEVALGDHLLATIVAESGLPPGVVNVVTGGRETGAALVRHPGTDKICFTGSTAAGRDIGAVCGAALKPYSAELGGKSAAVVLEDADLEHLRAAVVPQCVPNSGQVCYSLTRIIAPATRFDEVVDALTTTLSELPIGDPTDPATVFGPIVTARQRDRVESYIEAGRRDGARTVIGGGRPSGLDRGYYVEPTVFVDVDPRMSIFQDEIFGPVLVVVPYESEADAVRLANDSTYGLSGAVFGSDADHAAEIGAQLETGRIYVNGKGASRLLTGHKASGAGATGVPDGIHAYERIKEISFPV